MAGWPGWPSGWPKIGWPPVHTRTNVQTDGLSLRTEEDTEAFEGVESVHTGPSAMELWAVFREYLIWNFLI